MEEVYKPKHNPWIIAVTVTLATIMEVLDTSIANVALPHIAGSLGASEDQSTWVITSYLVANAIILPIGAYLGSIVGRKKFYMTCVAIFGVSSLLCGLAPSLPVLLFFRVVQGLGGGGLQPSEQSILADTFPPAKRGQAFAVYGLAVVTAPIVGPTLGGWITDNYDWRWIFFITLLYLKDLFTTRLKYLKMFGRWGTCWTTMCSSTANRRSHLLRTAHSLSHSTDGVAWFPTKTPPKSIYLRSSLSRASRKHPACPDQRGAQPRAGILLL